MDITREMVERGAAAIANARGGRRGMPPISNIRDLVGPKLWAEVIEDAGACLEACHDLLEPQCNCSSYRTSRECPVHGNGGGSGE